MLGTPGVFGPTDWAPPTPTDSFPNAFVVVCVGGPKLPFIFPVELEDVSVVLRLEHADAPPWSRRHGASRPTGSSIGELCSSTWMLLMIEPVDTALEDL